MALANKPDYIQFQAPQVDPGNADLAKVMRWLDREMRLLAATQLDKTALELRPIHVVPPEPREGMIVYADGTRWNPGAGSGPYVYSGGVWVPLIGVTSINGQPGAAITISAGTGITITSPSTNVIQVAEILKPVASGVAAAPGGITGAAEQMVGLGSVTNFSITPSVTGRVAAMICGTVSASANNANFTITGRHGTGTPPANGAAATGTLFSTPQVYIISTLKDVVGFTVVGGNPGLALGTSVWFDLSIAVTAGGTVTLANVQCLLEEI